MCTDHNRGNIIIIEFFEDSNICLIEKLLSSLSGTKIFGGFWKAYHMTQNVCNRRKTVLFVSVIKLSLYSLSTQSRMKLTI